MFTVWKSSRTVVLEIRKEQNTVGGYGRLEDQRDGRCIEQITVGEDLVVWKATETGGGVHLTPRSHDLPSATVSQAKAARHRTNFIRELAFQRRNLSLGRCCSVGLREDAFVVADHPYISLKKKNMVDRVFGVVLKRKAVKSIITDSFQ